MLDDAQVAAAFLSCVSDIVTSMASLAKRVVYNIHWFVDQAEHRREARNRRLGRRLALQALETGGNNYLIVVVAGLGFFTDSYLLFASNAITS